VQITLSVHVADERPPCQLVNVMKQRKTFPTNVADGVKGISEGLPHDSYEHIGKSSFPMPRQSL
jgi:hypothetical protein